MNENEQKIEREAMRKGAAEIRRDDTDEATGDALDRAQRIAYRQEALRKASRKGSLYYLLERLRQWWPS